MKILVVSAQLPHPGRGGANVHNYYLLAEYSWEQAGTQLLHVLAENC